MQHKNSSTLIPQLYSKFLSMKKICYKAFDISKPIPSINIYQVF